MLYSNKEVTVFKEFSWSDAFVSIKFIAFVIFVAISGFISVNLFIHLSNDSFDQYVMLSFALALELLKVYLLVRANTLMRVGLKQKAWVAYSIYAGSIIISIIASFGFTLTVLDRSLQESSSSPTAIQISQTQEEIQQYRDTIKMYQDSILTTQGQQKNVQDQAKAFADLQKQNVADGKPVSLRDFNPAITKLSNTISDYQTKIQDTNSRIPALNEKLLTLKGQLSKETESKKTTSNMFELMSSTLIGTFLEVKDSVIRLILLVLIAVLIEIGVVITSPSIEIDQKHIYHFLGEDLSKDEIDKIVSELFGSLKPVEPVEVQEIQIKKPRQPRRRKQNVVPPMVSDEPVVDELVQVPEPVQELPVEDTAPPIATQVVELEEDVPVVKEPSLKERKLNKKRYRAGIMSSVQKDELVEFIHALFKTDTHGVLLDRALAGERSRTTAAYIEPFFNILIAVQGKTGLPLIERVNTSVDGLTPIVYKPNYTKSYIISYLTEEIKGEN